MLEKPIARTKIIATLGPACATAAKIKAMVQAGVTCFRLNMSHGDNKTRLEYIENVKKVRQELKRSVSILVDLRGPRIRLGKFPEQRQLIKGSKVTLVVSKSESSPDLIPVDYKYLASDLMPEQRVLIRDGRIALVVEKILDDKSVICVVRRGGTVSSNQGVNLPDTTVSAPALSAVDRKDIKFAVEQNCDWLALSFVRSAEDIAAVRRELAKTDLAIPIMAKIEHPMAIENLDEIIRASNGLMVARGDLAVEMGHEVVPTLQKRIVRKAIEHAIPVVVATQMLESMIENAEPTRAEVSDVGNAVLDGADSVMLSGETAVGAYPVEVCRIMRRIARRTEEAQFDDSWRLRPSITPNAGLPETSPEMAITNAAVYTAHKSKAALILAFTESGRSARLCSSFRAKLPIVACTMNDRSFHRMSLFWGVSPVRIPKVSRIRDMNKYAAKELADHRFLRSDQLVVALTGAFAVSGATNTVRLVPFERFAPKTK
ncbi:MAG: pyruvate kinase [Planctomycetes bacterium]|nr:pyruvate kinase [Planctomycetota bacterium]